MNRLRRCWVWMSRIHRCWGFGIQSPKDYAFVREVVNEHWPYYAYNRLKTTTWLERKMGRLCLRLANSRQPAVMEHNKYDRWWEAGCQKTRRVEQGTLQHLEMALISITDDWEATARRCDSRSMVVVEDIWRDWQRWHQIEHDSRVGTTFDLYYCGIVTFDKERYAHNYKVNF